MKRETQIVKVQAGGWLATGDKYSVSGENQVKLETLGSQQLRGGILSR